MTNVIKKSRLELDDLLASLQANLPRLVEAHSNHGDFDFGSFAGEADAIVDVAGEADLAYVKDRLQCMLSAAGLVPSNNVGVGCTTDESKA